MAKRAETEIARSVVEALRIDHEVFQEVSIGGDTVDIVARTGSVLWAVEVKTSLNLQVIGQAMMNRRCFHYSSVAVPAAKRGKGEDAALRFLEQNGLGMIVVKQDGRIYERLPARFHRRVISRLVHLCDEQKTYAEAGNAEGRRFTLFRATRDQLYQYVARNPGCSLKDAIENTFHHYSSFSSARNCIRNYIKSGVITEIQNDDGRLYVAEAKGT